MKNIITLLSFLIFISLSHSKKTKTIYLVRNGETNFNTDSAQRVGGRTNVPLNDLGVAHCKAAGNFLSNKNIGKIYYSSIPRAKQSAELIAKQHKTQVEMVEEPLVIDMSYGTYEGKTYQEAFGDDKGGNLISNPEKLIIPEGETFYAVMNRLRLFLVKFWESNEEVCTIVSHGSIMNILNLMFLQAPLEKFWSMQMSPCGVSKVQMNSVYSFNVEYWNSNEFLAESEKKSISNRVCQILKIEKPVIQGPMFWLTDAKLVAAVSEAGGLGVLGPHAGQHSLPKDDVERAERMRAEIRKVKELTSKPFGINIFHSAEKPDVQLELMLKVVYEEKVPVAVVVHDGPEIADDIIKELKAHGVTVVYRHLNFNPEFARQAEKAGADIIVATGMDEGGTLPNHNIGTFSIVPLIVDSVKIPVMAAGGITDRRTFNAAFALGAEGVFCGTLFLSATEARTSQNVKEMMLKADATDIDFFRTIPYYYRSIPTPLSQKLVQMDKELKTREELYNAMHPMRNMKFGMLDGQTDVGYVSVGLGVSMIKSTRTSKEIIADITHDFKP